MCHSQILNVLQEIVLEWSFLLLDFLDLLSAPLLPPPQLLPTSVMALDVDEIL